MSTQTTPPPDPDALARTPAEYERLRIQARVWEPATMRLRAALGLRPGARCLDAGCGPGETMRLTAERVRPSGRVTGIDLDAPLGGQALAMLRAAGHDRCEFARVDLPPGTRFPARRSTWSTRGCCSTTCRSASPCCGACGTPSLRAATC